MPTGRLKLDEQLCFSIYAAGHAFTRFYRPLLGALDLTYPQYLVMLVLWEGDDIGVKAVGERLGLDSGTLTPLLKRLVSSGLVVKTQDAGDARQVRIGLTDKGRALRTTAESFPHRVLEAADCTRSELVFLREALFDLRRRLDEVTAEDAATAA